MIDSRGEKHLPSMLKDVNGRHDSTMARIKIVKDSTEKLGIFASEEFKNDEHYWLTVMNRNHIITGYLRDSIRDKDQLRIASLSISVNEAEEFMKRDKQKSTDGLTGAWSRIALDNFMENLRAKPRRGTKTGFLLIDVDHFKEYNDTRGHTEGDKLLKELAELLKSKIRSTDMAARYGGEEFGIALTNLSDETSRKVTGDIAESIRGEIEKNLGITVSIGTTTIKDSDQSIVDIYKRADKHLYLGKNLGRNVVCSDGGIVAKRE